MAHTTTVPALSLSRAVCGSVTTAAVISGAVLIASTPRKAFQGLFLEACHATQAERWAAAERASCDRVDEVVAASRLGKLVVRFDYDLTLLVAGRRICRTRHRRRGRDVGGVE